MTRTRNNKNTGYTLIEMLFYIAVLILISVALVGSFLSLDTVLLRNKTERELTTAARSALERISRDIRGATALNIIERSLPNELAVDAGVGTTTEFYLSGGQLYVDVNNETVGPLTPESVAVKDITFTHYEHVAGDLPTEAIRVALTLSVENKAASTTKTFYTSAIMRGTYE